VGRRVAGIGREAAAQRLEAGLAVGVDVARDQAGDDRLLVRCERLGRPIELLELGVREAHVESGGGIWHAAAR
jgi:hypothetical protein